MVPLRELGIGLSCWHFGRSAVAGGSASVKGAHAVGPTQSLHPLHHGRFSHESIVQVLVATRMKLRWASMDKSSIQPGCSVPPLQWMFSSGHPCETERSACFVPTPIGLSTCLFSTSLCSQSSNLSPSRLLTKLQTHSSFPRNLCISLLQATSCSPPSWWSGTWLCPLREFPLTTVFQGHPWRWL